MEEFLIIDYPIQVCHKCGARLIPIIYGEPTLDLFERSKRGELVIGGCCVDIDKDGNFLMPEFECKKCHRRFKLK